MQHRVFQQYFKISKMDYRLMQTKAFVYTVENLHSLFRPRRNARAVSSITARRESWYGMVWYGIMGQAVGSNKTKPANPPSRPLLFSDDERDVRLLLLYT